MLNEAVALSSLQASAYQTLLLYIVIHVCTFSQYLEKSGLEGRFLNDAQLGFSSDEFWVQKWCFMAEMHSGGTGLSLPG